MQNLSSRFHAKWAASRHGQAMQPLDAADRLAPHQEPLTIGTSTYQAIFEGNRAFIKAKGNRTYPIAHIMGGKNVYYFLTPTGRGRLQVFPSLYDIRHNTWYDMAASGTRAHGDRTTTALP